MVREPLDPTAGISETPMIISAVDTAIAMVAARMVFFNKDPILTGKLWTCSIGSPLARLWSVFGYVLLPEGRSRTSVVG
jgi:hypothetical protein